MGKDITQVKGLCAIKKHFHSVIKDPDIFKLSNKKLYVYIVGEGDQNAGENYLLGIISESKQRRAKFIGLLYVLIKNFLNKTTKMNLHI